PSMHARAQHGSDYISLASRARRCRQFVLGLRRQFVLGLRRFASTVRIERDYRALLEEPSAAEEADPSLYPGSALSQVGELARSGQAGYASLREMSKCDEKGTPPRHGHHAYQRSQASSDRDERRRYPHPCAQQPTQVAPRAVPEAPVYALHQALHGRPDAGGSELGETHRRREPDQVEDRGPYELSREERGLRRDPQPVAAGGETDVEEESQGQAAYSRGHDGIRTERALQFPREPRRQNAADRERGPDQDLGVPEHLPRAPGVRFLPREPPVDRRAVPVPPPRPPRGEAGEHARQRQRRADRVKSEHVGHEPLPSHPQYEAAREAVAESAEEAEPAEVRPFGFGQGRDDDAVDETRHSRVEDRREEERRRKAELMANKNTATVFRCPVLSATAPLFSSNGVVSHQGADRLQPTDGAGRHARRPHEQTHLRDEAAGAEAVHEEEKADLRPLVDGDGGAQFTEPFAGAGPPPGCEAETMDVEWESVVLLVAPEPAERPERPERSRISVTRRHTPPLRYAAAWSCDAAAAAGVDTGRTEVEGPSPTSMLNMTS
ncbi:hypothetical protein THAOC_09462, partial [Thalassiosira oceanica]